MKLEGPMGKGLMIKDFGIHMAFLAGTGILIFLDLVAHIVRKNIEYLRQIQENPELSSEFKDKVT